jgi:hypothetical protein
MAPRLLFLRQIAAEPTRKDVVRYNFYCRMLGSGSISGVAPRLTPIGFL